MPDASPPQDSRRSAALSLWAIGLGYLIFPISLKFGFNLILLGIVLELFRRNLQSDWTFIRTDPLAIVLAASFFLALLGASYSVASWDSGINWTLTRYWKYMVAILLIALMRNVEFRKIAIYAFFAAISFIVVSMYLSIWWQLPWSATKNLGFNQDHTVIGDYITQNLMVTLYILIGIHFAIAAPSWAKKACWLASAIFGVIAIFFFSPGRTGFLLTTFAVSLFFLIKIKSKYKWLAPIFLTTFAFTAYKTNEIIHTRVNTGVQEARTAIAQISNSVQPDFSSIGARIYMWENTWKLIKQRPFFGWGLGSYKTKWCEQVNYSSWCNPAFSEHPHNQYLMAWVELGLPGVILLLLFIAIPIRKAMQAPEYAALMVSFIGFFALDCFFNGPLWVRMEYHFFLLMIPVVYSLAIHAKADTAPDLHQPRQGQRTPRPHRGPARPPGLAGRAPARRMVEAPATR